MNFNTDVWSYTVCETYPAFAYGEMINNGTRGHIELMKRPMVLLSSVKK